MNLSSSQLDYSTQTMIIMNDEGQDVATSGPKLPLLEQAQSSFGKDAQYARGIHQSNIHQAKTPSFTGEIPTLAQQVQQHEGVVSHGHSLSSPDARTKLTASSRSDLSYSKPAYPEQSQLAHVKNNHSHQQAKSYSQISAAKRGAAATNAPSSSDMLSSPVSKRIDNMTPNKELDQSVVKKQSEQIVTQQMIIQQLQSQISQLMSLQQKQHEVIIKKQRERSSSLLSGSTEDNKPIVQQTVQASSSKKRQSSSLNPPIKIAQRKQDGGYDRNAGIWKATQKAQKAAIMSPLRNNTNTATIQPQPCLQRNLQSHDEIKELPEYSQTESSLEEAHRRRGEQLDYSPEQIHPFSARFHQQESPAQPKNIDKLRFARQIEKNNEALLEERYQDYLRAQGCSFRPSINHDDGQTDLHITSRSREDLLKWQNSLTERKAKVVENIKQSQETQKKSFQIYSRMCPGTIKILQAAGTVEKVGSTQSTNGVSVILGSPVEAGKRLYNQAMESIHFFFLRIHKRREYAAEVIRLRDLEMEPTITYPGFRSRSKILLSPTTERSRQTIQKAETPSETFESFKRVSQISENQSTTSLELRSGIQAQFGMRNGNQGANTRNLKSFQTSQTSNASISYKSFAKATQEDKHILFIQPHLPVQSMNQHPRLTQYVQREIKAPATPQMRVVLDRAEMKNKLNMYIHQKYSENVSRTSSDSNTQQEQNLRRVFNQQESAQMAEVAQLERLTPCMNALQASDYQNNQTPTGRKSAGILKTMYSLPIRKTSNVSFESHTKASALISPIPATSFHQPMSSDTSSLMLLSPQRDSRQLPPKIKGFSKLQ